MLNVQGVLDHRQIRSHSHVVAVQDVSALIRESADPVRTAVGLFKEVLDVDIQFHGDDILARITTAKMIEQVVKNNCQVLDIEGIVDYAKEYADEFCDKNTYLYAKKEVDNITKPTIQKQVVQDIDVKVAVKQDGSIKKGGKQQLAVEMYKKHVTEAVTPLTNQQFIVLLMKELEMSKAGATTYAYNCKKVWI